MYGEKMDSFPPSRLTDSESPKFIFGKHFSSLNEHSKWSLISGKFGKPWNVTGRIEEEDLACGCYPGGNLFANKNSHLSG